MTRSSTAAAIAALAALAVGVPVTAQAFEPSQEATMSTTSFPLRGTWQVMVDPRPAPDGSDQPAFESTLAYSGGNTVSEATSRAAATSAGVGAWSAPTRTAGWSASMVVGAACWCSWPAP